MAISLEVYEGTYLGDSESSVEFLADIAHNAVPDGLEDGDTEIGGASDGAVHGDLVQDPQPLQIEHVSDATPLTPQILACA